MGVARMQSPRRTSRYGRWWRQMIVYAGAARVIDASNVHADSLLGVLNACDFTFIAGYPQLEACVCD